MALLQGGCATCHRKQALQLMAAKRINDQNLLSITLPQFLLYQCTQRISPMNRVRSRYRTPCFSEAAPGTSAGRHLCQTAPASHLLEVPWSCFVQVSLERATYLSSCQHRKSCCVGSNITSDLMVRSRTHKRLWKLLSANARSFPVRLSPIEAP